jgi:hypothetical protein
MDQYSPSVAPHAQRRSKAPFFIALGITAGSLLVIVALVAAVIAATRSTPQAPAAAGTVAAPDSAIPSVSADPIPSGNPASQWYQKGHMWGAQDVQQHGGLYTPDQALLQCQAFLGRVPVAPDDVDWFGGCVAAMTGK